MEFRILGPLEVRSEGRPLALGGTKQRAVLAVLLLHRNEVVSIDRLIDELWADHPPATAVKVVQVYVSQLRKALRGRGGRGEAESVLVTRAPGYQLLVEPGQLDVDTFERLVEEGRRALAAGNPRLAARMLLEGLALWRGPALADFALDSFAQSEAARLEEARVSALEERIEADLALGRHAELVGELESLVAAHPLRERLRGQLMLALYRSGRQAEALDAYRDARRTLVDELGLEPGPGLQQLERAILSQDAELAGPAPFDPEPEDDGVDVGRRLPHGTVTLLFTDIEGSTQLQRRLDEGYHEVVTEHWRMLEAAFAEHGGVVVDRQTESFFVVFRRARQASLAAAAAQASLAAHDWPDGVRIKVRMGMHSGDPEVAGDRYVGLAVSRAARICAAAHGGQVLMSSATRSLLTDDGRIILRNLGSHRLKDFDEPEPISQLVIDGLPSQFPPLRTEAASSLRKPLVLIGAGLLVAGAIAAAVVLATGGKSAPIRAVPINSLARIDANTGRLKGSIPVGVRPTAVAVGEGSLWVANFDEQTVSRVDPATRKELTRIPAGGAPTGLAVGGGFVWVTHGFAGTVSQIDPGLNRITATFPVGSSAADVAVVGNAVWIVKKIDGAVLRIDPSTGAIVRTIAVGGNPTSLAAEAHSLWIADGRSVIKVDVATNRVVARIALRHQATRVALGGGAVWVSANLDDVVTRIDIATGAAAADIRVGQGPVGLAADRDAVWVADGLAGAVSRIDPATNRVVETIPVGRQPGAIALTGGSVWVTVVAL